MLNSRLRLPSFNMDCQILASKWFVLSGMAIMTLELRKLTVILPGNFRSRSKSRSIMPGVMR